jgi:hypothetical protein
MQPIRAKLGNTTKLLISPDSQLNLIPFAALVDEQNRYLVETTTITYLTSGRDLLRLQNQVASRQPPVLIANPDYANPGNPTPTTQLQRSNSIALSASLSPSSPPSPPSFTDAMNRVSTHTPSSPPVAPRTWNNCNFVPSPVPPPKPPPLPPNSPASSC